MKTHKRSDNYLRFLEARGLRFWVGIANPLRHIAAFLLAVVLVEADLRANDAAAHARVVEVVRALLRLTNFSREGKKRHSIEFSEIFFRWNFDGAEVN